MAGVATIIVIWKILTLIWESPERIHVFRRGKIKKKRQIDLKVNFTLFKAINGFENTIIRRNTGKRMPARKIKHNYTSLCRLTASYSNRFNIEIE